MGNEHSLDGCCQLEAQKFEKQHEAAGRVDQGMTRRAEQEANNIMLYCNVEKQNQVQNQPIKPKQSTLPLVPERPTSSIYFGNYPDSLIIFKQKYKRLQERLEILQKQSASKKNKNKIQPIINVIVSSNEKRVLQPQRLNHNVSLGQLHEKNIVEPPVKSLNNSIIKISPEKRSGQNPQKGINPESGRKFQSRPVRRNLYPSW